ncbi:haloacid dehalogenase type II [Salarchaeum japonicum]|uniref:Haloacid dehalogenase type II n=1 Tax=Salarchaeum japonicum TaxID=555573 RepID=A0AAV3T0X3_9EURY|nr:haloacid dehalogenase type II [Salarchaeum japonicum]
MDALCFDMYGTLCDTSSVTAALRRELDASAAHAANIDATWRRRQLEYAQQRSQMNDYATFHAVTGDALDYALARHNETPSAATRDRILDAYDALDPFPDALGALDALRDEFELAVLSNGNPEMLDTLAATTGIDERVSHILSADAVSTFKPTPAVYEHAANELDRPIEDCWLVSSNAWDVAGASNAGMNAAWVNRENDPEERVGGRATVEVESLAALPDAL